MTTLDTIFLWLIFAFLCICFISSIISYVQAHNAYIDAETENKELNDELLYYKALFEKMKTENRELHKIIDNK